MLEARAFSLVFRIQANLITPCGPDMLEQYHIRGKEYAFAYLVKVVQGK